MTHHSLSTPKTPSISRRDLLRGLGAVWAAGLLHRSYGQGSYGQGSHGQRSHGQGIPRRIVSTAPSSTEALFALGLGPQVVGVSSFCEYPPQVRQLPRVGTYVEPDVEAIMRLRPDLVALQRSSGPVPERLQALGIKTVQLPYGNLADVFASIDLLARAAAVPDQGQALSHSIRSRLDAVRARGASRPRIPAILIVDRRPGLLADLVSAGPGSYVGELMEIAGADNLLGKPGLPLYPRISFETILRVDPAVIVDLTDAHDEGATAERARDGDRQLWAARRELRAVREGHVYVARSEALLVPGPRSPEAASLLWDYFHGTAAH